MVGVEEGVGVGVGSCIVGTVVVLTWMCGISRGGASSSTSAGSNIGIILWSELILAVGFRRHTRDIALAKLISYWIDCGNHA